MAAVSHVCELTLPVPHCSKSNSSSVSIDGILQLHCTVIWELTASVPGAHPPNPHPPPVASRHCVPPVIAMC
jgi:hypothetical protein